MTKCAKCDKSISKDIKFCPDCGSKIKHNIKKEENSKNHYLGIAIIVGIIVVATIIIISVVASMNSASEKRVQKMQDETQKQIEQNNANLRCQSKCKSTYYEDCKEISCKYNMGIGCIVADPDEMECAGSVANSDGSCSCECECGFITSFKLS
ncbi:MAG: hypothetical protein KJ771_08815 [Nanoarchaeota archaeon]|nr:hypothetical protein [Nanoarchaeota archaeon]